jgi:hypothetical protein
VRSQRVELQRVVGEDGQVAVAGVVVSGGGLG